MKKTIIEKAVSAINELNKAALIMARQMKSGEINKALADKAIFAAIRTVPTRMQTATIQIRLRKPAF